MNNDFTYEPPDKKKFLASLKRLADKKGSPDVKKLLQYINSCSITHINQFSKQRWNEYLGKILFSMQIDGFDFITDETKEELLSLSDFLLPDEVGIRLFLIDFVPIIDEEDFTVETEIQALADIDSQDITSLIDLRLIETGKRLSQVFQYLYIIENCLRSFIEAVFLELHGPDYFSKINLSRNIISTIKMRKDQEKKNSWLCVRGDSDLFYLDFADLGYIIKNNWDQFKKHFPSQQWIDVKIDELYRCRNLIAHNSNLGSHEIDVIKTNFRSILYQIKNSRRKVT